MNTTSKNIAGKAKTFVKHVARKVVTYTVIGLAALSYGDRNANATTMSIEDLQNAGATAITTYSQLVEGTDNSISLNNSKNFTQNGIYCENNVSFLGLYDGNPVAYLDSSTRIAGKLNGAGNSYWPVGTALTSLLATEDANQNGIFAWILDNTIYFEEGDNQYLLGENLPGLDASMFGKISINGDYDVQIVRGTETPQNVGAINIEPIPEPATLALLVIGGAYLAAKRNVRKGV